MSLRRPPQCRLGVRGALCSIPLWRDNIHPLTSYTVSSNNTNHNQRLLSFQREPAVVWALHSSTLYLAWVITFYTYLSAFLPKVRPCKKKKKLMQWHDRHNPSGRISDQQSMHIGKICYLNDRKKSWLWIISAATWYCFIDVKGGVGKFEKPARDR